MKSLPPLSKSRMVAVVLVICGAWAIEVGLLQLMAGKLKGPAVPLLGALSVLAGFALFFRRKPRP